MNRPLRIELLGPLRIRWQGRPVAAGAQRLQALLAVLALRANHVCTPEELLDLVWHDNPPGTGLKVLPPYIYRLRRTLPVDILDRTADGYVLRLPEDALDLSEFEHAVRAAERCRDAADLDAAASHYRRALDLFRGEPLAGLPGQYLAAQRMRLVERRDKVFGDRVDVDLDHGRSAELVAELVPAVAAKPFDERQAGQLMRALSADGRQADALDVYTRTRDTLVDQLGVEPGPALREIHRTILRNESPAPTRDELPYAGAIFVGRGTELARLTAALCSTTQSAPPVIAVDGMAGAGKTALAVHTARHLATRYPDGLLFADLHGHTAGRAPLDVKAALDHLLSGVGVPANNIPHTLEDAQARWRTTVAGRRLLVILDNAPDSTTVAPLLPGSPTCGVLITSRRQLTGLDVRDRIHLDLLAPDDATALLVQLVGAERAAEDVAASNGLIERCGNLPLALRIAGARLRHRPTWTVAHINQRLDRVDRRLTELTADGVGIATTFQLSYDQLTDEQQRMFRLLSLLPGRDLDQYGAAALADRDPDEAADLAESLVDANLLLQPTPGRYQFHDLIRDYAATLARGTETPEELTAAGDRLLEYYLQASFHPLARLAGSPLLELVDRPAVKLPDLDTIERLVAWAEAETTNLAAAVERAAADGRLEYTWMLALGAGRFLRRRGEIQQQTRVLDLALTATQDLADPEAEVRVRHAVAQLTRGQEGVRAAIEQLRLALDRLGADGNRLIRGRILSMLGHCLRALDPFGEALPVLEEAIRIARELGDDWLLAQSLAYLGILLSNQEDFTTASAQYEESLAIYRRVGPTGLTVETMSGLAGCYVGLGRADQAIEIAIEAYELSIELRSIVSRPYALGVLGRAHRLRGDLEEAVEIHRRGVVAADRGAQRHARWLARLNLGDSLLAIGDLDEAAALFDEVLQAAMADKNHQYMVDAWKGLADHAAASRAPERSADYLRQALAVTDEYLPAHSAGLRDKLAALDSAK